jgi:hypothetical protein
VAKCHHLLLKNSKTILKSIADAGELSLDWYDGAAYYRALALLLYTDSLKRYVPNTQLLKLQTEVTKLLENNLTFDRSHHAPGMVGCYKHTFLCTDIKDENLPWNITETDW